MIEVGCLICNLQYYLKAVFDYGKNEYAIVVLVAGTSAALGQVKTFPYSFALYLTLVVWNVSRNTQTFTRSFLDLL
jgi:hypothetical protein